MDNKLKLAAIIAVATILLGVGLDSTKRMFNRYCDLMMFERSSRGNIESCTAQNRQSPLVEIVQTGVQPGKIEEEGL